MVSGLSGAMGMSADEAFETFSAWRTEVHHITDAVLFLASDNADQITGNILRVDAGMATR